MNPWSRFGIGVLATIAMVTILFFPSENKNITENLALVGIFFLGVLCQRWAQLEFAEDEE